MCLGRGAIGGAIGGATCGAIAGDIRDPDGDVVLRQCYL